MSCKANNDRGDSKKDYDFVCSFHEIWVYDERNSMTGTSMPKFRWGQCGWAVLNYTYINKKFFGNGTRWDPYEKKNKKFFRKS